jgi:hypothetical protein
LTGSVRISVGPPTRSTCRLRLPGNQRGVTTYGVLAEPRFVRDASGDPLPGHYEAEFAAADGRSVLRYLTDRGRAEVLRLLEEGDRALSQEEFDDLTVDPSLDALVARMEREGAVGA